MEPAPRPPLQPFAELPVEEPLDAGVPPREPPAAAAGAPAAPTSAGAVEPSEDADEADLNFTDPELFLAPDDPAGAAPAVSLTEAPKPPQAPLTLTLEDPVIDELLTTPALPAKATIRSAPGATPTAARPVASETPLSRGPSKPPAGEPAAQATRPAAAAAPAGGPVAQTATPAAAAVTLAAATAARAPAPAAPAPTTSPPMDRDFIARNQIVERYLSGRLPLKGATDFERFCREHPELLDEIGLPERVNAGLRLLEASGKPEPWQESARP